MPLRVLGSLDTIEECEASEIALVIEDMTADPIADLERVIFAELPPGRGRRAFRELESAWIEREAMKVAAALAASRGGHK
jgi:hypothetical protein